MKGGTYLRNSCLTFQFASFPETFSRNLLVTFTHARECSEIIQMVVIMGIPEQVTVINLDFLLGHFTIKFVLWQLMALVKSSSIHETPSSGRINPDSFERDVVLFF